MNRAIRKIFTLALISIVSINLSLVSLAAQSETLTAQLADGLTSYVARQANPGEHGAAGLGEAIKRLGVVASVLHTGAHPDDEDSGLLAYLARGRQVRTAYLSLTRGDGGQNLIGPELGEALGVIRTEELLAARRLDGATQFFTRAYDFGFSKSRDEALSKWDRDKVLGDMVKVIRYFRPFVIVSSWSGTPRDGHGHHQAAGFLTREAYTAAADPSRYPEQIRAGLQPWKAKKFYIRVPGRAEMGEKQENDPVTVSINTGQFDPLLGRSYYEIAMQGRSQHRSQDMGTIQRRGPQYSRLKLVDGGAGTESKEDDIFAGIDTTITGIADYAGKPGERLRPLLSEAQKAAERAQKEYRPFSPSTLSATIAQGLGKIREARALLASLKPDAAAMAETDFLLMQKEQDFEDALLKAEDVVVDCLADDEVVTPGQSVALHVSSYAALKPTAVSIHLLPGISAKEGKQTTTEAENQIISQTDYEIAVNSDAGFTEPYWLKNKRQGDMFSTDEGMGGIEPYWPVPVGAIVTYEIEGQKAAIFQPAQYRYADKAQGEIRHNIKIAPAVSVALSPGIIISPISSNATEREVTVFLTNNEKGGANGSLSLNLPPSWKAAPEQIGFDLKREDERASFTFKIQVPAGAVAGEYKVQAIATLGGRRYSEGYEVAAYSHIEPRFIYKDSAATAEVIDVKVAPGIKVGYIEGAGDDFAGALKRLGVNVESLAERDLASGDLSRFDCIVTGIRAYEVRPDLIANNQRLLDYVKQGGTMIVQYNKWEYARGNFAPFPLEMAQSPDRVTDELADVSILAPDHPRFNFPNRITARDFDGWVQERGAYFMRKWDSHYKPLMSSHDAGEEGEEGGELIAEYGKGLYVYTAYGWFRQLPAGVPGAYRLIANLVSLSKAKR